MGTSMPAFNCVGIRFLNVRLNPEFCHFAHSNVVIGKAMPSSVGSTRFLAPDVFFLLLTLLAPI